MKLINEIYINGEFVKPNGTETFDLINPSNQELLGKVTLGDATDTQRAIAAAKEAFKTFSKTSKEDRIAYLEKMYAAVLKRKQELIDIMVLEYGGALQFSTLAFEFAISSITSNIEILKNFEFNKKAGSANVMLNPVGVVGIITPWNSNNGFICTKLSTAIAAGCTAVIKPSEMSAMQTQLITECLHEVGLPKGVFNIVNGFGNVVGAEITKSSDIAKISFTGSTIVGKTIARDGAETIKRITLELGGKSANIIMEDADLSVAIPQSLGLAYMNSGQACIAATRLLVPESKLDEVKDVIKSSMAHIKVGNPSDASSNIGPMVSKKQYDRVQNYIKIGIEEGAEVLVGGVGHPEGLESGNFVKPTVFVNVNNQMRIAREEIFGPVLSVIAYKTLDDAIEIANDTTYGLAAYVQGTDEAKAYEVATKLEAGTVAVNGFKHEALAPFGGVKQSGIGREFGEYGLEEYLEVKTILS
ncbi:aldehyde dehydrogenase family protein [Dysgonomonas sp. GY617]|uniref:aldehyde dehydrogenase family protein n=1 Tax=Dysgonomonas sp. GY617 TaxID=2780420 RepID=UPI0018832860|nr:aldehyde dehydrogenase family protein [Dysgonomonas sp. GY617]MBF0574605.1 aldehyde dehydrogenase family protein [Dysgonomonas sp. GY617]